MRRKLSLAISIYTERKKWSHFDLKSRVTGGTKIRPGIPSNWRMFESSELDIECQFELQYRVNFTLRINLN